MTCTLGSFSQSYALLSKKVIRIRQSESSKYLSGYGVKREMRSAKREHKIDLMSKVKENPIRFQKYIEY